MPPVTPSAINPIIDYPITRLLNDPILLRRGLDLLDRLRDDFLPRDGGLLVLADRDARRRYGQELARPGAGGHDELERVGQFAAIDHQNVLTMASACARIRDRRARSAMTML